MPGVGACEALLYETGLGSCPGMVWPEGDGSAKRSMHRFARCSMLLGAVLGSSGRDCSVDSIRCVSAWH